jgi:6,7-dimethyl-8-ribityllumazine synthase
MQHHYSTENVPKIEGAKIALLQSKWHSDQTNLMVEKCAEILGAAGAMTQVHVLPGSLELPLAADRLAKSKQLDAIVCFGVIMKGETFHFDLILNMIEQGFVRAMHDNDIPILIEVLPVTSMAQVEARAGDNDNNKGIEAALAAIEIVKWRRENPASL